VSVRVYQSIGVTLRALGTDTVFGLMGDGNLRFITYMADALGMRYVGARHENAAVAMADGYARVGDGIGVCSVTQGPGLTNALTALTEAAKGRTPLLLIAGDTPAGLVRHNQDIDQDAVVGALKVASHRLRGPETAQADLRAAAQRALVESRPVVVSVPTNLQDLEIVQPDP
jgi:acetolactate synthase I/II/III large subunit